MKKIILVTFTVIIAILVYTNSKNDYFVIPDEAIRFRIIANSDSLYDQFIKHKVKENIEPEISNILKDSKTIEESRRVIKKNINDLENNIQNTMVINKFDQEFDLNYGLNYFPKKEYDGIIYNEGEYESLVITLGTGEGDNWWCVLFPPVCFSEFEDSENVEYKLYIEEVFDKFK